MISEALNEKPLFQAIVTHINKLNGINKYCECDGTGMCCESNDDFQFLLEKDPRCHHLRESFDSLCEFEQARRLFRFHASCISNVLSFYGEDFSVEESLCVGWCLNGDWFYGLESLCTYNTKAYWLFMGLIELELAKGDLSGEPYWYLPAFSRLHLECAVWGGSDTSYRESVFETVREFLKFSPPKPNERRFGDDWEQWSPSLYLDYFESTVTDMLNQRDERADSFLGETLADRLDFMHKARVALMPRLQDIFPLEHMPIFEEDYEPSPPAW